MCRVLIWYVSNVSLKGHCVVLEMKFKLEFLYIYNIKKITIQTQKYVSYPELSKQAVLRGNKIPRTLCEARKLAGSAKKKKQGKNL